VFLLAYCADLLDTDLRAQIRRLLKQQLIVAVLASLVRILLLTGAMTGELSGMFDREMAAMILGAGEGLSAALRLSGLALAAFALAPDRRWRYAAVPGAVLAAISFAAVGHTRALQPHALATTLSCLHLIGVAFWLGALGPLLVCTRSAAEPAGLLAKRFGDWALWLVAALISAGLSLLWMLSRPGADFWSSGYGRMFIAKLLLVVVLLSAAGINKLNLTPRLLNGEAAALRSLRLSVRWEMAVALVILAVTASFTSLLGPPR
jgi:putative copper resistance protein D